MANVIAVIWDCDKTLIDGYMQDPIFKEYSINSSEFWKKVNSAPEEYEKRGIRVNKDTYYLNHFIDVYKRQPQTGRAGILYPLFKIRNTAVAP